MSYIDQFLQSVRRAFTAEQPDPGAWLWAAGALLCLILLSVALSSVRRRWRQRRALAASAKAHGLSTADLCFLLTLTRPADVSPLHAMMRLAVFEHVTALALAREPRQGTPSADSRAAHIAALRHKLGFDTLPPHARLLTTRELQTDDLLCWEADDQQGRVQYVNESTFGLRFEYVPGIKPSAAAMQLTLVRPNDAHYDIRCEVVEVDGTSVRLAHDEHPARRQMREFVRARVHGPVTLALLDGVTIWKGSLRETSAGGLSADFTGPLTTGTMAMVSFQLAEGEIFEHLGGKILSTDPAVRGKTRAHVSFTGLNEQDRARLARCVTWHECHGPDTVPARRTKRHEALVQ